MLALAAAGSTAWSAWTVASRRVVGVQDRGSGGGVEVGDQWSVQADCCGGAAVEVTTRASDTDVAAERSHIAVSGGLTGAAATLGKNP